MQLVDLRLSAQKHLPPEKSWYRSELPYPDLQLVYRPLVKDLLDYCFPHRLQIHYCPRLVSHWHFMRLGP